MTNCTPATIQFPAVKRRVIEANFTGGHISSNGGVMLLREADRRLGLLRAASRCISDTRDPDAITHSQESQLKQRVFSIALGEEDLNDHTELRQDMVLQTAVGRDQPLSSASTLFRFEQRFNRKAAVDIHKVIIEQFIASYNQPPKKLILDFDATDDRVHGNQEGRFYHGYYHNYCFLPLYVFCGQKLLVSYLRKANQDGAAHAWAILALLVKRLRQMWPKVRIIFRADSGFCRWKMLNWCDRHAVDYIVGIGGNQRLLKKGKTLILQAEHEYQAHKEKARLFDDFTYAAKSWTHKRRIIIKAEHTQKGSNTRFVTTSLKGDSQVLYDTLYCARGEMENRIKEQQLGLFADRTSAHGWWSNQLRVLLSALAYILLQHIREGALQGTKFSALCMQSIRHKLLKIGVVILRNTRRVRLMLSESYPHKDMFIKVAHYLME